MKGKGKGKGMNSPTGLCSSRSNPLPKPKMTQPTSGSLLVSPSNADQAKVRNLRAKAFKEKDSLRGANGI